MNGEATDANVYVNAFVKQLQKKFLKRKLKEIDERFNSKMHFNQ